MKSLGILLLAIAVGVFAYFKGYPWLISELGIVIKKPVVEEPVVVEEPPPPPPEPEPMPEPPKPEPPPPPPPPPAPVMADTGLGEMKPKVDEDGFELPIFETIEELTKNWTAIPASAFSSPRQVTLKKPVSFELIIGNNRIGSQVPAGGTAYSVAAGAQPGTIVVAPSPEAKARTQVNIDDTNLKDVLSDGYERWKVQRTAALKRAWLRAKNAPLMAANAANANAPIDTAKPTKAADGTYKVLLDSMSAGDVTEVTPSSISKWEDPVEEEIDGKKYWTIVVTYTTKTMFGDFTTHAKALIYNGRVEKWIYRDSGEVVP